MAKNPFMSAYLSAANRVANTARGKATTRSSTPCRILWETWLIGHGGIAHPRTILEGA